MEATGSNSMCALTLQAPSPFPARPPGRQAAALQRPRAMASRPPGLHPLHPLPPRPRPAPPTPHLHKAQRRGEDAPGKVVPGVGRELQQPALGLGQKGGLLAQPRPVVLFRTEVAHRPHACGAGQGPGRGGRGGRGGDGRKSRECRVCQVGRGGLVGCQGRAQAGAPRSLRSARCELPSPRQPLTHTLGGWLTHDTSQQDSWPPARPAGRPPTRDDADEVAERDVQDPGVPPALVEVGQVVLERQLHELKGDATRGGAAAGNGAGYWAGRGREVGREVVIWRELYTPIGGVAVLGSCGACC